MGWNTIVSFWGPAYFQVRTVSFREGTTKNYSHTMRRGGGCSKGKKKPVEVCLGVPGTVSPFVVVDVAHNVKEVPEVHSIQADNNDPRI